MTVRQLIETLDRRNALKASLPGLGHFEGNGILGTVLVFGLALLWLAVLAIWLLT
jgi:hypothetical protein